MRCANGYRQETRSMRRCVYLKQLDLVVKIERKSLEYTPQFQGVLRLTEGSKRLIISTGLTCYKVLYFNRSRLL